MESVCVLTHVGPDSVKSYFANYEFRYVFKHYPVDPQSLQIPVQPLPQFVFVPNQEESITPE